MTQKGRTRGREAPRARCSGGEVTSIAADRMWEDGGPKCRPEGWEGWSWGQAKGAEKAKQARPSGRWWCCSDSQHLQHRLYK